MFAPNGQIFGEDCRGDNNRGRGRVGGVVLLD